MMQLQKTIFCQKNFNEWHLPRLYDIKKHEIEQHILAGLCAAPPAILYSSRTAAAGF